MKTNLLVLTAALGILFPPLLRAEPHDSHDADHAHAEKAAGPNGGRVIDSVDPHFEFFVTPGRMVKITFLGADGNAVAPAGQIVTAIGGDRSKPTRLSFAMVDGALISDKALPEGNMIPLVLQVKVSPESKSVNTKFMVNLAECPGCRHKEYACVCEH